MCSRRLLGYGCAGVDEVDAKDRKDSLAMMAEALREMGVLLVVFGVLDSFMAEPGHEIAVHRIPWCATICVCSVALFFSGLKMERDR